MFSKLAASSDHSTPSVWAASMRNTTATILNDRPFRPDDSAVHEPLFNFQASVREDTRHEHPNGRVTSALVCAMITA